MQITDAFRESYKTALTAAEVAGGAHAALQSRVRDLRTGFQALWGDKPAPVHLLNAMFISQGKPEGGARDLWFFSETHCMVAPGFMDGNRYVMRSYALSGKVIGLQIEREVDTSDAGFTDATVWLHGHVNLTLCGRGANRGLLDQVLQAHFVPNLR